MGLELYVENLCQSEAVPGNDRIRAWALAALDGHRGDAELSVRIVGEAEGRELNQRYRGLDKATNVLSFPAELPTGIDHPLLGDLVICAPVVGREAAGQRKDPESHWAHLVIHGVLHLLGFDHQLESDAIRMEAMEVKIMAGLGFPDPYRERATAG